MPRSPLDEATLEVGPLIAKRTAYLAMLANVATLLGLLGAVLAEERAAASEGDQGGDSNALRLARVAFSPQRFQPGWPSV